MVNFYQYLHADFSESDYSYSNPLSMMNVRDDGWMNGWLD